MKKVLALTLALIMALSAAVTAFAATDNCTNTCPYCQKSFDKESEYNAHIKNTIPVKDHVKHCPYSGEGYKDGGCTAQFVLQLSMTSTLRFAPSKARRSSPPRRRSSSSLRTLTGKKSAARLSSFSRRSPSRILPKSSLTSSRRSPSRISSTRSPVSLNNLS